MISAEVSVQIAITKTEYFDGADSALTQLYAIRAKLDVRHIAGFWGQLIFSSFGWLYEYQPCAPLHERPRATPMAMEYNKASLSAGKRRGALCFIIWVSFLEQAVH